MTLVVAPQQVLLSLNQRTRLVEFPLFSELSGWSVLGITIPTSALGMIWTTSTTTFHYPLLDLRDLVVHNLFNSAHESRSCDRSRNFADLLHDDLRNILCRHPVHPRGNLHNDFRNQLWISTMSALPRSVHVAEVVSEALV